MTDPDREEDLTLKEKRLIHSVVALSKCSYFAKSWPSSVWLVLSLICLLMFANSKNSSLVVSAYLALLIPMVMRSIQLPKDIDRLSKIFGKFQDKLKKNGSEIK